MAHKSVLGEVAGTYSTEGQQELVHLRSTQARRQGYPQACHFLVTRKLEALFSALLRARGFDGISERPLRMYASGLGTPFSNRGFSIAGGCE